MKSIAPRSSSKAPRDLGELSRRDNGGASSQASGSPRRVAKQNSTYFSPTCFFCGKNNKRRHSRVGRTWACGHCGEINPGPGMVRSMMAKLGNGHAETREPAAAAAPPAMRRVATTSIKGTQQEPAAAAPPAPKAKTKAAPAVAAAPATTQKPGDPTPPKRPASPPARPRRGFLEGLVYG